MGFYPGHPSASNPHLNLHATLSSSNLLIRSTTSLSEPSTIPLDASFARSCKSIRFHHSPTTRSSRVLLISDTAVQVHDAQDTSFHFALTNAAAPSSRLAHANLLSPDLLVVYPEFNPRASIYHIPTSAALEIRDPKPARNGGSYAVRAGTGHVAVLAKGTGGRDTVLVFAPSSRKEGGTGVPLELEASFALPTLDAQGVRWSPSGLCLAVWETAAMGDKVYVYTADGHLFREWPREGSAEGTSLGIRSCEWDFPPDSHNNNNNNSSAARSTSTLPGTGSRWLWLGTSAGEVIGLDAVRAFTPGITITIPTELAPTENTVSIWQEQISAAGAHTRSYAPATLPAVPPGPASLGVRARTGASTSTALTAPQGILHLAVSPTHLAAVDARTPTTVHIYSLAPEGVQPVLLTQAVLVHHDAVRHLTWHPTRTGALLVHCVGSATVVEGTRAHAGTSSNPDPSSTHSIAHWAHIWDEASAHPLIIHASVPAPSKSSAAPGAPNPALHGTWAWASSTSSSTSATSDNHLSADKGDEGDPVLCLSTPQGSVLVRALRGEGVPEGFIRRGEEAEYKSSVPIRGEGPEDAFDEGYSIDLGDGGLEGGAVDDTFGFRKGR